MRVLLSGSTGMVGSALTERLHTLGWQTGRLVRRKAVGAHEVSWDPTAGTVDAPAMSGFDAVVHLAGESIAKGRWTEEKKRRIRESRVIGTRAIAEGMAANPDGPRILICASAIGYYGSREDKLLDESSAPGDDFLAEVCQAWEAACEPARDAGIRVCNTRFGIILSKSGGALQKMLLPFKLMLGGKLGNGSQWMSWVALDDVVSALHFLVKTDEAQGPFNVTAPHPVRNKQFTKALGTVLKRFTPFPMPGFLARLVFGEMADALLLSSTRVAPKRLQEAGFAFAHTEIEPALRQVLDR